MSSANPSSFTQLGTGMSIQRMCAVCHKPRAALGSGIRMVAGYRCWACADCKAKIDAKREKMIPSRNSKGTKK